MLLQRFFSHFISSRNTVKNCEMDLRFVFIVFLLKWTHAQGESSPPTYSPFSSPPLQSCTCGSSDCVCECVCVCLGILFVQLQLLAMLKCSFSHLFKCRHRTRCKYAIENGSECSVICVCVCVFIIYPHECATHSMHAWVCVCLRHSNEAHLAEAAERLT